MTFTKRFSSQRNAASPGLSPRGRVIFPRMRTARDERAICTSTRARPVRDTSTSAYALPRLSPRVWVAFSLAHAHAVWNHFTHAYCPDLSPQGFISARACALPLVESASCTSACARAFPHNASHVIPRHSSMENAASCARAIQFCVRTDVTPTKFSYLHGLPYFLRYGAPRKSCTIIIKLISQYTFQRS